MELELRLQNVRTEIINEVNLVNSLSVTNEIKSKGIQRYAYFPKLDEGTLNACVITDSTGVSVFSILNN